jgi:hypothetical protein
MSEAIIPAVPIFEQRYEDEVTKALLLMAQLLGNAPDCTNELIACWTMILQDAEVEARHIAPATRRLLADPNREGAQFFPTPAVLIGYARDLTFVPVVTAEPTQEELHVRYEWSRRRMAADKAHFEAVRAEKEAKRLERFGATVQ